MFWNWWWRGIDVERRPTPDNSTDEYHFRVLVMRDLLHLRKQMERLMSASDDLKAAAAAMDGRIDALSELVAAGTTVVLAAITAIVAGQNPDGSIPADVANAIVADMQAHLTAAEAKVADLGPAVAALDAAVHPAPAAPPA